MYYLDNDKLEIKEKGALAIAHYLYSEDRPISARDIAAHEDLNYVTVKNYIKSLEREGYYEKSIRGGRGVENCKYRVRLDNEKEYEEWK